MEISYWQSRWRNDKTGWHMDQVFPLLKDYWPQLGLDEGSTVLVPLCGKSLDIDWLVQQGHYVIGVDVSERALNEVMDRQQEPFTQTTKGSFTKYLSPQMELWCGDILKLRKNWLPPLHAAYDKAALIALPPEQRPQYTKVLQSLLLHSSPIFLNCFEYNQVEMNGPPFAVFENELSQLLGNRFTINLLNSHSLFDELPNFQRRGLKSYLIEKIYHLQPQ